MPVIARRCLLAIGVAVLACGGSEEKGLYSGGNSGGLAGASSGGAPSGGSGAGGVGGSGGAPQGGAPSGGVGGTGGTAAAGGTSNTGGGSGGTSATGGKGGSGGTVASGGTGAASGVGTGPCGTITCAFSAGDACCKVSSGPPYCSNEALSNPCKCQGIGCDKIEIKCDGPEDCGGKICCAEKGLISATWDLVECRETCKSDQIVGSTRREVCHLGGKPCLNGAACVKDPWLPPDYSTCAQ